MIGNSTFGWFVEMFCVFLVRWAHATGPVMFARERRFLRFNGLVQGVFGGLQLGDYDNFGDYSSMVVQKWVGDCSNFRALLSMAPKKKSAGTSGNTSPENPKKQHAPSVGTVDGSEIPRPNHRLDSGQTL